MYRYAFPTCPVQGSIEPTPFRHMSSVGAVPTKCGSCRFLLEASCTRAATRIESFQDLDHGPCPVEGDTSPVEMMDPQRMRPFSVPRKCASCSFLRAAGNRGYKCSYQQELWGAFPRSLDWGRWLPAINPLGINAVGLEGHVIATEQVLSDIQQGQAARAVIELKRLYPRLSTAQAIKCIALLRDAGGVQG